MQSHNEADLFESPMCGERHGDVFRCRQTAELNNAKKNNSPYKQ